MMSGLSETESGGLLFHCGPTDENDRNEQHERGYRDDHACLLAVDAASP